MVVAEVGAVAEGLPGAATSPSEHTEFAAAVVQQAGRLLLDVRSHEEGAHEEGSAPSGTALGDLGRRWAELLIRNRLMTSFPGDAVVCGTPADGRGGRGCRDDRRTWLVVPLDDERAYGRPGSPYWAVHLALREPGLGVTAAAVAVPALCSVVTSTGPRSLWHHPGRPPGTALVLLHDGERGRAVATALAGKAPLRPRPVASAGARTVAVVDGTADVCLHTGAEAGEGTAVGAVAEASGLRAIRLADLGTVPGAAEGDVLLCRAHLADALHRALASSRGRLARTE
ncbi:inositol monophosphatase family protein [Streptomyces sp. DH37]|uniref:inositol monophosphatase family protein n=1 Tax=Streptomyces sp. DH37 TaxID=3040122 RepID=UPI002441148F|nr:inositol monophosphatase family protein [Streptomyces sp. DH37]MDG9704167.1 inositol monophosphatase family protein [Streptomyces sp. DH37]